MRIRKEKRIKRKVGKMTVVRILDFLVLAAL